VLRTLKKLYSRLPIIRELYGIDLTLMRIRATLDRFATTRMITLLDLELRDHPRYGDPKRLFRHQFQVCSQNGEDGIIHEILRRIGVETRTFVEVGIGDGTENNTAFLLSQGWSGYWLDGDDAFVKTLRESGNLGKDHLKHAVAFITKENIATLFGQLGVPRQFDLLSLDIDQNTYYAWEALQDFSPRVVVVEYNAALPPDVDWKVRYDPRRMWNRTQNYGASLKALEKLGRARGYSLVGCDFLGVNAFFVRDDLVPGRFAEPYTSENHHEPPRYAFLHRRSHRAGILDRPD
jgi:hypothetical protein